MITMMTLVSQGMGKTIVMMILIKMTITTTVNALLELVAG